MARQKQAPETIRKKEVRVLLSPAEHEKVMQAAQASDRTIGAWVRHVTLEKLKEVQ